MPVSGIGQNEYQCYCMTKALILHGKYLDNYQILNELYFIELALTQLLPFELFSKKFCLKISELGLEIV